MPSHPEQASKYIALLAMIPVCVVELMTTQDFAIINGALGPMSRAFGVPVSQLHWAISSQLLTVGGLLVLAGWAGDQYGKRPIFIAGLCVTTAGNLLAWASPSFAMLIAARVLTGSGLALMLPTALSLIADLFPKAANRDRALSAISVSQLIGLPSGAFVGGILVAHFGWQSGFLLNGFIALATIPLALCLLPAIPKVPSPISNLDWAGMILIASCSVSLIWTVTAIEQSGITSAFALGSMGTCIALSGALTIVEIRARFPILPAAVLKRRTIVRASSLIALITCLNVGLIFTFSLTLQSHHVNPSASTWLIFLPMALGSFSGSLSIAPLIARTSRAAVARAGLLADILLVLCYTYLTPESVHAVPVIMFAISLCMLAVLVPIQTEVFDDIPESMRGIVSSLIRMSYNLPTGIGIAVVAGAYSAGGQRRALLSAALFGVIGLLVFALTGDTKAKSPSS